MIVPVEKGDGTLADKSRRIELFRNGRAVRLRTRIGMGQAVLGPDQRTNLGFLLQGPAQIIAPEIIAMAVDEFDMGEAVVRRLDAGPRVGPISRPFLRIGRNLAVVAMCLRQAGCRRTMAGRMLRQGRKRRRAGDVLEMAFADQACVITGGAQ